MNETDAMVDHLIRLNKRFSALIEAITEIGRVIDSAQGTINPQPQVTTVAGEEAAETPKSIVSKPFKLPSAVRPLVDLDALEKAAKGETA